MTKYLIIEKTRIGYTIKDTITNNRRGYIGYSLQRAIKLHRAWYGLQKLHFEKIYI